MTIREMDTAVTVVHVSGSDGAAARAVDAALAGGGFRVERAPDVYVALGRILSAQGPRVAAVVVRLEEVDGSDLEFFGLVRRVRPEVRVYLYGRSLILHESEVAPLESMRVEPEYLVPRMVHDLAVFERMVTGGVSCGGEVEAGLAGASAGRSAPAGQRREGRQVSGEVRGAECEESPPVPWAPSSRRPARTPPAGPPETAGADVGHEEASPTGGEGSALLSTEEIEALLGSESEVGLGGEEGEGRTRDE